MLKANIIYKIAGSIKMKKLQTKHLILEKN